VRKFIIPLATIAATAATMLVVASANAVSNPDVLTYGSAGGTNVAVGNTLSGSLASGQDATWATTSNGSEKATCTTSALTEKVTANPTSPGTADTTVQNQTFSNCSNSLGLTIQSATISSLPYPTTINDSLSNPVGISSLSALVVIEVNSGQVRRPQACGLVCPQDCHYIGTNLVGTDAFVNQPFDLAEGGGVNCPAVLYYSADYGPLQDTSISGDPTVYLN
jgi:hypothetical protein